MQYLVAMVVYCYDITSRLSIQHYLTTYTPVIGSDATANSVGIRQQLTFIHSTHRVIAMLYVRWLSMKYTGRVCNVHAV